MTAGECLQNKWFYMKYIGKYLNVEILLTCECVYHGIVFYFRTVNGEKVLLSNVY